MVSSIIYLKFSRLYDPFIIGQLQYLLKLYGVKGELLFFLINSALIITKIVKMYKVYRSHKLNSEALTSKSN